MPYYCEAILEEQKHTNVIEKKTTPKTNKHSSNKYDYSNYYYAYLCVYTG